MQYVGGKQKSGGHRIAVRIRRFAANAVVEPFCGGLSVTYGLGPPLAVSAGDACQPLITPAGSRRVERLFVHERWVRGVT